MFPTLKLFSDSFNVEMQTQNFYQIDERVSVVAVETEDVLLSWHGDLLDVLRQLDLRLPVYLDQLVHATEGRLALTRD